MCLEVCGVEFERSNQSCMSSSVVSIELVLCNLELGAAVLVPGREISKRNTIGISVRKDSPKYKGSGVDTQLLR